MTRSALGCVRQRHACAAHVFAMADEAILRADGHGLGGHGVQLQVG